MTRALVHGWRRSQIFQKFASSCCYNITKNREKEHLIKPISCFSLSQCREAHNTSRKSRSAAPQIQTQGQTKPYSPFESKILGLVKDEIQYQSDYAPPHQPAAKFEGFMVEDRPGEQWVTLRGKSAEGENIKIEATMFDGSASAPKSGDESTGEEVQLHISLLVDIWKGEQSDLLEFVCSAWPDALEIQKVYIFRHGGLQTRPYMGPNIKDMSTKLHNGFYEFLKTRGVNDNLSKFLHEYMMNKDRIELIQWLQKVQSFFEN
ncbi:Mitochondrial glycoprotein family protein [Abeliophyllum distichum]|uniref:Mitochondrial glycoprotein family protein n=1 Tax=Abeliophyllum distichum TaxID=126358 RepID=A0ABD1Q6P2_9LAMI